MNHETTFTDQVDALSRLIAKCRFGPGVTMDGRSAPRPSEIQAARMFLTDYTAWVGAIVGIDGLPERWWPK